MSFYDNSPGMVPLSEEGAPDLSAETTALHDAGLPPNDVQQIAAIAANVKGAPDDAELDRRGREIAHALERRFGIDSVAEALDGAATLAAPVIDTLKKRGLDTHPRVVLMFAERYMKSRNKK